MTKYISVPSITDTENTPPSREDFTTYLINLHEGKDKAYGDAWKKRGEMIGILSNIARKVDRLGVAGGGDTSADTAVDLLIYLVKYRCWLSGERAPYPYELSSFPARVGEGSHLEVEAFLTAWRALSMRDAPTGYHIEYIKRLFEKLEPLAEEKRQGRENLVDELIEHAYPLAYELWVKEQEDDSEGMDLHVTF